MNDGQARNLPRRFVGAVAVFAVVAAAPGGAEQSVGFNLYGGPGLIDMPTAEMPEDAMLSSTVSRFGDNTRTTLTFQIAPRLSGSFRYSAIDNFITPSSVDGVYYDRSFDLRYQVLTEGQYLPSVVIGLQDFIGTGLYGGEYVVATKTLAPGLKITGGLGWGRLGSHGSIGTLGTRPEELLGEGGLPTYDRWFRGDVAPFGGISYAPSDRLRFKLEYSSDDYVQESTTGAFDKGSPWSYGVDYTFRNGTQLSLYHAYGTEIGAQLTFNLNPRTIGIGGGIDQAPLPIDPRAPGDSADLGWTGDSVRIASARQSLAELMDKDGLKLEALQLESNRAVVRLRNPTYNATSQAVGRTARAMSRALPASVEQFEIVSVVNGVGASSVIVNRSDLERLEHDDADQMLARTTFADAYGRTPAADSGLYPRLTWSLAPYLAVSVFDPDSPVRADFGLRAKADWRLTPNLVASGSVTKRLTGDLDSLRLDESNLPRVRTDYARYSAEGDPAIEYLTLAHYGRPGRNLYSRVTLGYLEPMYAGASAELLWKPVNSRLALGAELNYVRRRDFDQRFGLQSNETVDPVSGRVRAIPEVNGHVSAYYDFGNGFHGQLDVGRYLAGDYGATVSLDREFANGWRIGAYATVTDTPFEDFGEGSFDKGLRVTIPLAALLGQSTRQSNTVAISSLTRDGGARLNVNGRLYDEVRGAHQPDAAKSWGRFWR
ncbi:YjbH domain-containing protein [Thalassococcus sp. CAU 1522]|uniref:YjbH domain-containing protein n=2 Tax=Thalassococcus arenae TaxID=2851652 RepID=A0ABS6N5Q7_9RHOB|nr:YjbH domain-containing protein [Thalassococcus arenae]MBV2359352.1 YjbH domain-containing protein [Thalassococcus arenae]